MISIIVIIMFYLSFGGRQGQRHFRRHPRARCRARGPFGCVRDFARFKLYECVRREFFRRGRQLEDCSDGGQRVYNAVFSLGFDACQRGNHFSAEEDRPRPLPDGREGLVPRFPPVLVKLAPEVAPGLGRVQRAPVGLLRIRLRARGVSLARFCGY